MDTFSSLVSRIIVFQDNVDKSLFSVPKDEEEIIDTKEMSSFPGYELLSYRERKVT